MTDSSPMHTLSEQATSLFLAQNYQAALPVLRQLVEGRADASYLLMLGICLIDKDPEVAVEKIFAGLKAVHAMPKDTAADPFLRGLLDASYKILNRYHLGLHERVFLDALDTHSAADLARVKAFLTGLHFHEARKFSNPLQRPSYQYFPGLPAKPWHDAKDFKFLKSVCDASDQISFELRSILQQGTEVPSYVADQKRLPDDWLPLATQWNAIHLYKGGVRQNQNCALAPVTAAVIEQLPLATSEGNSPEVFFSILQPNTHIPPHYGLSNAKLAVHLPLVIPECCSITVGHETREWTRGECLVFDDSFLHEAENRSDKPRAVLIFEIWHPDLTPIEIDAIQKINARSDQFLQRYPANH